jgi:hypothetical protein
MIESRYPELWQLILGYFNEDSNEWGEGVEEIIQLYKQESSLEMRRLIISEINKFNADGAGNVDAYFIEEFGGAV